MYQQQLVSPSLLCPIVFFNSLSRSRYLSFFLLSFIFTLWSARRQSPLFGRLSFLLLTIFRSVHLADVKWSVSISKPQKTLSVSFPWTDSRLCIYHLFVWSNLNIFCTIPSGLPSPRSRVSSYALWVLIYCIHLLIVLSLLLPSLHLQFFWVLSIFALI